MTAALTGALQHVDPEDIMNAVKQKAGEVEQVLKPIRTAASPYAQNMMDNEISLVANAITDKVPESSAAVGTVAGVAQSLVSAAPLTMASLFAINQAKVAVDAAKQAVFGSARDWATNQAMSMMNGAGLPVPARQAAPQLPFSLPASLPASSVPYSVPPQLGGLGRGGEYNPAPKSGQKYGYYKKGASGPH